MWEFSVALYMIHIWPDSLLLTALYGVVESASVALFGPIIGQWVNTLTYVKVRWSWTHLICAHCLIRDMNFNCGKNNFLFEHEKFGYEFFVKI